MKREKVGGRFLTDCCEPTDITVYVLNGIQFGITLPILYITVKPKHISGVRPIIGYM